MSVVCYSLSKSIQWAHLDLYLTPVRQTEFAFQLDEPAPDSPPKAWHSARIIPDLPL